MREPRINFGELVNGCFELASRHRRAVAAYVSITALVEVGFVLAGRVSDGFWPEMLVDFFASYFLLEFVLDGERLRSGLSRGSGLAAYLGVTILVSLAMIVGLALLILPGLIFLSRWTLASPLVVAGELSVFDAMRKSWEQTRRSQWSLVGFYALSLFAVALLSGGAVTIGEFTSGSTSSIGAVTGLATVVVEKGISALIALAGVAALQRIDGPNAGISEIFG
jgi:hypothetical protein